MISLYNNFMLCAIKRRDTKRTKAFKYFVNIYLCTCIKARFLVLLMCINMKNRQKANKNRLVYERKHYV